MKKKAFKKQHRQKPAEDNLFERLSNKKRFDVIGRKVKGETRHTGKLRSEATERRKSTLLVEYKQLRKSNAFIDRRFGEDDETLNPEERAILRFQKQRMREMAGGKFSLPDEDEGDGGEMLTHLGRSLAEIQEINDGWNSDEDFDQDLDAKLTRDLHFGGGLFTRKSEDQQQRDENEREEQEQNRHRSKKEIMEEVIAKSKAYKAIKQQQREDDLVATEDLDAKFNQLTGVAGFASMMRPKGLKPSNKADNDDDRKFDVLTKELLFEAKAQPGNRTLSPEELAELERQRLESLEQQRLKRQRTDTTTHVGGDDLEDDFEDEDVGIDASDVPKGGYAARRAKRAKLAELAEKKRKRKSGGGDDDALDSSDDSEEEEEDGSSGSEEEESDEEGLTKLEKRRRERAGGDHPLQHALREAAARLLAKHNGEEYQEEEEDEDEEGATSSEEEEDEEEDEKQLQESPEEDDEENDADDAELSSSSFEDEKEETEEEPKPQQQKTAKAASTEALKLSFTPPLPETYADFAQQADGLNASDLGEILGRIRAFNSAALNTEGRKKAQVLYGCIVQHYVILAGMDSPSLAHLDALLPHILDLTNQVPFYAVTIARARLQKAQQQLASCLKDPLLRSNAWPAPKTLLLYKLLAVAFPVSDKRHPVLTPMGLLMCHTLAHCPVVHPRDAATGLYLSSLVLGLHASASRYTAEPLTFAVSLLEASLSSNTNSIDWLSLGVMKTTSPSNLPQSEAELPSLQLQRLITAQGADEENFSEEYWTSDTFKIAVAASAVRLIQRMVEVWADVDALPEIMARARVLLQRLIDAGGNASGLNHHAQANGGITANGHSKMANGVSSKSKKKQQTKHAATSKAAAVSLFGACPGLVQLSQRVLDSLNEKVSSATSRRQPLSVKTMLMLPTVKQYNPRFEDDFALGKDYDPDRERSERRKMQRALKKEERGAMRELRRDAAFMAGVRDREKANRQADLDTSARRAMSFLQQQESDFKSGGQGGQNMWKKKKKK